jgi:hypothetical protein
MPRQQPRPESSRTAHPPTGGRSEPAARVNGAFDPDQILNPGKVFPKLHRCAELGRMRIHHGKTCFPDLPRF